jgi:hypothetical protein
MHVFRFACVVLLALTAGCTVRNVVPTGPSAQPEQQTAITPPQPVLPTMNARLARDAGPVTLTVENAATSSASLLTYTFEGSADPSFAGEVFRQTGIAPGASGRTSVSVPGPLPAGRTFYWRALATDGTTTSPFSTVFQFTVFEPFVLSTPGPVSPADGETVGTTQPTLRTLNADRRGTAEAVSYEFEVSATADFGQLIAQGAIPEQDGTTAITLSPLSNGRTHFWRVRARSESSTTDWSAPRRFVTPAAATPTPPTPSPSPSPSLPPSNPGPRPNPVEGTAMVAAVIADLRARGVSLAGPCGAFEITKRVAWAFRNRGAGTERKPGGTNCESQSIDIIIFTDGQTVDMVGGAGSSNTPSWNEQGVLSDWRDWWIAPVNPD